MYDIVIPSAEKDFTKLRFVYDSVIENLSGFQKIFCITNVKVPDEMRISGVTYLLDAEVIDFNFDVFQGTIKNRCGWYRQQFVKLFQNVTSDDYLVTEADSIYNKKVDIFEDGKPVFLLGKDQHHIPYYELTQKLFGFGREYPYSFINESMLFKRELIKQLVSSTGFNKYGFFALVAAELNRTQQVSGMAEYELYGNYITKFHPGLYNYKYLKIASSAKHRVWSVEEIKAYISSFKKLDVAMIKMHSWI
jgi:hypothetical protein